MTQQPTSAEGNPTTTVSSPSLQGKKSQPNIGQGQVTCHKCNASICTGCRSLTHDGECKESDLDAELVQCLKKLKVKRCPKCRTGVRRGQGCAQMKCRCGTRFCFYCLQLSETCQGQCARESDTEDEEETEEETEEAGEEAGEGETEQVARILQGLHQEILNREVRQQIERRAYEYLFQLQQRVIEGQRAERELEARAQQERDDAVKSLAELEHYFKHIGDCAHEFHHAGPHNVGEAESSRRECDICTKPVKTIKVSDANTPATKDDEAKEAEDDEIAWECKCGMVVCGRCNELHERHGHRRPELE